MCVIPHGFSVIFSEMSLFITSFSEGCPFTPPLSCVGCASFEISVTALCYPLLQHPHAQPLKLFPLSVIGTAVQVVVKCPFLS